LEVSRTACCTLDGLEHSCGAAGRTGFALLFADIIGELARLAVVALLKTGLVTLGTARAQLTAGTSALNIELALFAGLASGLSSKVLVCAFKTIGTDGLLKRIMSSAGRAVDADLGTSCTGVLAGSTALTLHGSFTILESTSGTGIALGLVAAAVESTQRTQRASRGTIAGTIGAGTTHGARCSTACHVLGSARSTTLADDGLLLISVRAG